MEMSVFESKKKKKKNQRSYDDTQGKHRGERELGNCYKIYPHNNPMVSLFITTTQRS